MDCGRRPSRALPWDFAIGSSIKRLSNRAVITSYSIHYTKLYDDVAGQAHSVIGPPGLSDETCPRCALARHSAATRRGRSRRRSGNRSRSQTAECPPAQSNRAVITSYSIHYTKLYDDVAHGDPFLLTFLLPDLFFTGEQQ